MSDTAVFEPKLMYVPQAQVSQPVYRTKKLNLVLIGGRMQVGKSTAARYIQEKLTAYEGILVGISPLARPLKINASEFYRWDGKKDERGRRLLQEIGDVGRAYDEDIFVRYLEENELSGVFMNNFVLVDDWRYPNERTYFDDNFLVNVTTVRIEKPNWEANGTTTNHKSETSLPSSLNENLVYNKDSYYNFEIHNIGDMREFHTKLNSIIDYLAGKIIKY